MAELWDAYDKNFNKIENMTLVRGEPIPDGIYHLVSEVIVKHTDGSYLLMQRDFRKHHGGEWEVTAGGSALKGENGLEAAMRELKEETGLCADEMKEITRVVHDGHHSLYIIYLCASDFDKNSVVLQEGETIDYKWVEKETFANIDENELAARRTLEAIREYNL